MTQIDHIKQAIIEQVTLSTDANLLDFLLKLLIAES